MLTTIVDLVELAREGTEMGRKNAKVPTRQKNSLDELLEALAAVPTMCGQITAAEDCMKALKTQLADAQLTHEKLAKDSIETEADFGA